MMKLGFKLDVQDGWPPFEIEHLWVEKQGKLYSIENAPFFVKNLAVGDLISAEIDEYNYVINWKVEKKSGNSTAWIIINKKNDVLDKLELFGCQVEGGPLSDFYSVNIPNIVDFSEIEKILSSSSDDGFIDVAYPAVRHEG